MKALAASAKSWQDVANCARTVSEDRALKLCRSALEWATGGASPGATGLEGFFVPSVRSRRSERVNAHASGRRKSDQWKRVSCEPRHGKGQQWRPVQIRKNPWGWLHRHAWGLLEQRSMSIHFGGLKLLLCLRPEGRGGFELKSKVDMVLTKKWLREHSTARGGFTKAQVVALGFEWPLKHGWQDELLHREFTQEQVDAFIAGREVRSPRPAKKERKVIEADKPAPVYDEDMGGYMDSGAYVPSKGHPGFHWVNTDESLEASIQTLRMIAQAR